MIRIFDWQLKKWLLEETWSFPYIFDASTIKDRIVQGLSLENSSISRLRFRVTANVNRDRIIVSSTKKRIVTFALSNKYYFSGNIKETPRGSVISGEYRSNKWARATSLFGLNFMLFGFIVTCVSGLYFELMTSPENSEKVLDALIFFILYVGVMTIFYFLFRLITFFEKIGRSDNRGYLEWVAKGDASPQSN